MTHPRTYDVVVVGLGIMGAAACYELSRRGVRVLGVEARGPLHDAGSSHGRTRIFRRAYWEGERYVPLLDLSYQGWRELDEANHGGVTCHTGGLFVGDPASVVVQGSRATAQRCGIEHEYLDADEVSRRFPAFRLGAGAVGVYEPDAMMLFAEQARLGYLTQATDAGAELRYGQAVRAIEPAAGDTVTVVGDDWQVSCGAVVLTVGGWVGRFLPAEIAPHVTPMRIPVFDFAVADGAERSHSPAELPVFLYEDDGGALVYGLPQWQVGGGVKIGFHNRQLSPVDLTGARRPPTEDERLELWRTFRSVLPGVTSDGRGTACVYTMSSDESFLIGRSQELPGVAYASACSGHGFKFAPCIGSVLADLAVDGKSALDISAFGPERLQ